MKIELKIGQILFSSGAVRSVTAISLCVYFSSGTGWTAKHFRDSGYVGQIDGIEMNAQMLDIARKRGLYRQIIVYFPSMLQLISMSCLQIYFLPRSGR